MKDTKKKNFWTVLQKAFGFYRNPEYIENRLEEADVRSAIYISTATILLEIFMLIRYMFKYVFPGKCETIGVYFHYTYGYWVMLISGVLMLVYSQLYITNKLKKTKRLSRGFIFIYFSIGIYFGLVTSLNDFGKGREITCFLAMMLYVSFIFVVRPYISLIIMSVCGVGFILLVNNFAVDREGNPVHMESGNLINYITFFISLTVLTLTIYYQRYGDAQKAYKLQVAAITDELTGAPNIAKLTEETQEYIEKSFGKGKTPLFLVLNLKNFQTYNDRFGYDGGNELLKNLPPVIKDNFPDDPYARINGDKFVVLTDKEDYVDRVYLMRTKLKEAFPKETYLDIRAGVYKPTRSDVQPRKAIDRANYAMHTNKLKDGEVITEYDEKCRNTYKLRQHILNNLDEAVKGNYIKAYYQPVVDYKDGSIIGFEALARWIDPELGFLSPGQFIPILEESRQIHRLDRKIYDTVLSNMRECMDKGLPVLPVSMNYSRLDFELMDAVGELEQMVKKYNIPKDYIHVEITESALTDDEDGLRKEVEKLHELGYFVWLDDFGSGYSSLNVLKDFKFDVLKIDMVFLKNFNGNENSRRIIKAIINLAKELGMETLTEGVETAEAEDFLRNAGCDKLQGYYYGKPQPYEEILEKISNGTYKIKK